MAVYQAKYDKSRDMVIPYEEWPRSITLWASGRCNFKCCYCVHGRKEKKARVPAFSTVDMSWETFLRVMGQLREFRHRPDTIIFCGIGEPLLNERLPFMIDYIKGHRSASSVEVTTNGSLLTHDKSLALAAAGLDFLNISIQGVTDSMYRNICGYPCDIDDLAERIGYFYRHKGNCQVHLKTVDIGLGQEEEPRFMELFSDICDTIHIDSIIPLFPEVDYKEMAPRLKDQYTGKGLELDIHRECRLPSLSLFIQPEGRVVPCCVTPDPVIYGNVYDTTLLKIWNSIARREFVKLHKDGGRKGNPVCSGCVQPDILG